MAAYEILLLNTAIPQIQAAQSGDTYVVPRDISFSAKALIGYTDYSGVGTNGLAVAGNVGIGTSSPGAKLEVNGAVVPLRLDSVSALPSNQTACYVGPISDTAGGGINGDLVLIPRTSAGGSILFATGSTTPSIRMKLDSSGNLGLGVPPSTWSSAVASQVGYGAALSSRAAGNTASDVTHGAYWNGTNWLYQNSSVGAARYQMTGANAGSTHAWFVSAGGTQNDPISFTQAMTLDASGNLLVGTTTTVSKATIFGTGNQFASIISATGSSTQVGINLSPALSAAEAAANPAQASIYAVDSNYSANIIFANKATGAVGNALTERARITSGGMCLFGTTNDYSLGTQPGYVLAKATLAITPDNTASADNRNWALQTNGYDDGSFDVISSSANNTWANNAYRMSVTRAGSTYNTTGTYGTLTSDERLKQDIVDAGSQWADIKALRFRKFKMRRDVVEQGDAALLRLGVIAQEAAAVSPGLVTERAANEQDIRDNPDLEGQTVMGFKDSILFWKAAVALQEAMSRIETLEAEVAALKGN